MIEGYRDNQPTNSANRRKTVMILISVAEIVGGTILIAGGATGPAGAMLLAAGTSSLINGHISQKSGGSFFAGWVGGQASGAFAGFGLNYAAPLYNAATFANTTSSVLTYASDAFCLSGLFGFLGGFASSSFTQLIDKGTIDPNKAAKSGFFSCLGSVFATPFSAIPSIISKAAPGLAGGISVVSEWAFNSISSLLDRLFN